MRMKTTTMGTLASLAVAMALALGLVIGMKMRPSPITFEGCMLAEMRGQMKEMVPVAARLCRSRFP